MTESSDGDDAEFYAKLISGGPRQRFLFGSPDGRPAAAIQDIVDRVLRHVRQRKPAPEVEELLQPDRVRVATVPEAPVQAVTLWTAPRHAIVVNMGLMLFMYRIARAIAPYSIARTPDDPPAPPESQAVSICATLLDWLSSPVRAPLVEDWPTGPREVRTAENITTAGERFVIAHEISHILLRHLVADTAAVDVPSARIEDLDARPVAQETEADVFGAVLSIESMITDEIDPRAAVVGIVMFFRSLNLAEQVGAVVPDEVHLPADVRLAALRSVLPQRYGDQFAVLTSWADELDTLLERVGAAALRERDSRRAQAVAYLDRVFQQHPSTTRPDRDIEADRAMLREVQGLLSTAPGAVLEAVTANLLSHQEYTDLIRSAATYEAMIADDRLRRHSIAHFIGRYLPPKVRQAIGITAVNFTTPEAYEATDESEEP